MYESLKNGCNVKCDAVAGGAKSTTILYAIHRLPHLRFLGLTYNSTLAHSTNTKASSIGLSNCVYQTFHSTMGRIYNTPEVVRDDTAFECYLSQIERGVIGPRLDTDTWDCLIVDEAQDLRFPYFRFVWNLVRDVITKGGQLVFLGSHDQVLYDYYRVHPADVRYMCKVERLLNSQRTWVDVSLSKSFRLTPSQAAFVNHLLGQPRVIGVNHKASDTKIDYWVCRETTKTTLDLIYGHFIKPNLHHRVCLLFPSIQSTKCRRIVNYFIDSKAVDVQILNQQTPACVAGVFVATYHASKGMEFEAVVVFGLQDKDAPTLSNALNVALTRCCGGRLLVLHDCHNSFQPFSENLLTSLGAHVHFRMLVPLQPMIKPPTDASRYCSLNTVLKFTEPSEVRQLAKLVQIVEGDSSTLEEDGGALDPSYVECVLIRAEYQQHGACAAVKLVLARRSLPGWALAKLAALDKKPVKTHEDVCVIANLVRASESIHHELKHCTTVTVSRDTQVGELTALGLVKFNDQQVVIKDGVHLRTHVQAVDTAACPYLLEVGPPQAVNLVLAAVHAFVRTAAFGYVYNLSTRSRVKVTSDSSLLNRIIQLKFQPKKPALSDDQFEAMCRVSYTEEIQTPP
jgi:hypothetical protein